MSGITVVEVFRAMDVDPVKSFTWTVGKIIAKRFTRETGAEPPKANRPKTSGTGVHCFAIYPESYRAIIAAEIRAVASVNAARPAPGSVQGGLF